MHSRASGWQLFLVRGAPACSTGSREITFYCALNGCMKLPRSMRLGQSEIMQTPDAKKAAAPKQIAYLLAGVCFVLLPFHFWVDVFTTSFLAIIAVCMVIPLFVLGLMTPRSEPHRFLPQVFGVVFIVIHILVSFYRQW